MTAHDPEPNDHETGLGKRKRTAEEDASAAACGEKDCENGEDSVTGISRSVAELEEEEDEDHIYLPKSTSASRVKKGQECPYLDTISRQVSGRA